MNMSTQVESHSVIDHKELLRRCMGNQPFAAKILVAFQNQLTGDLDELDEAIEAEDYGRITAIAHRIKGSSSNVSAQRLNRVAAALEDYCKERGAPLQELRTFREQIRIEQDALAEATAALSSVD